jgi:hypothetical protein
VASGIEAARLRPVGGCEAVSAAYIKRPHPALRVFGMPEEAVRVRFREFMDKRTTPARVAFPGHVFAVSNIPIRVPAHFMGRDDALAAIETALNRYETASRSPPCTGCVASERPRSPRPTPSGIAVITARLGGSGHKRKPACVLISSRLAFDWTGWVRTLRKSLRSKP